jgi:hypothetical protein
VAERDPENDGRTPFVQQEILVDESFRRDAAAKFGTLPLSHIIRSVPRRIASLWNASIWTPLPPSWFDRFVQFHLLAIVLLSVAGIWHMRGHLRHHWPLWMMPVYLTAIHLVFHEESRYSLPARPFVLIYAAVAVTQVSRNLHRYVTEPPRSFQFGR